MFLQPHSLLRNESMIAQIEMRRRDTVIPYRVLRAAGVSELVRFWRRWVEMEWEGSLVGGEGGEGLARCYRVFFPEDGSRLGGED